MHSCSGVHFCGVAGAAEASNRPSKQTRRQAQANQIDSNTQHLFIDAVQLRICRFSGSP
jgi:hypothetical protein